MPSAAKQQAKHVQQHILSFFLSFFLLLLLLLLLYSTRSQFNNPKKKGINRFESSQSTVEYSLIAILLLEGPHSRRKNRAARNRLLYIRFGEIRERVV